MTQIVIAGLSSEILSHLQRRLGQVVIKTASSGSEVIEALAAEEMPLLVLDHNIENPTAAEVLREIRRAQRRTVLKVLYCLDGSPEPALLSKLVQELGVHRVLSIPWMRRNSRFKLPPYLACRCLRRQRTSRKHSRTSWLALPVPGGASLRSSGNVWTCWSKPA